MEAAANPEQEAQQQIVVRVCVKGDPDQESSLSDSIFFAIHTTQDIELQMACPLFQNVLVKKDGEIRVDVRELFADEPAITEGLARTLVKFIKAYDSTPVTGLKKLAAAFDSYAEFKAFEHLIAKFISGESERA